MKMIICGGSGFIGTALTRFWLEAGHEVVLVGRSLQRSAGTPRLSTVTWGQLEQDASPLENSAALVNLAGASLNQRWTPAARESILHSRLNTVADANKLLGSLQQPPRVVLQASAVGGYGTSEGDTFTEESPLQTADFPGQVVTAWEDAAAAYRNVRLVLLRIGIVLGSSGGAYPPMSLPYRLGAGGTIGSGRQWMSWIHLNDLVRLIDFCVMRESVSGPINAVAPHPVMAEEFGRTIGRVLRRPHWLPLPSFALRMLFGEMSILLLRGQRVIPQKAGSLGFDFRYPELEDALRNLSGR